MLTKQQIREIKKFLWSRQGKELSITNRCVLFHLLLGGFVKTNGEAYYTKGGYYKSLVDAICWQSGLSRDAVKKSLNKICTLDFNGKQVLKKNIKVAYYDHNNKPHYYKGKPKYYEIDFSGFGRD